MEMSLTPVMQPGTMVYTTGQKTPTQLEVLR